MRTVSVSFLVAFVAASTLFAAVDPAEGLATGRRLIDAGRYSQALQALGDARAGAATLPQDDRDAALGAIHFYTALAHFGMDDRQKTRSHLEEFFEITRHAKIAPDRYPRGFVDIFNNVSEQANRDVTTFDRFYPGFDEKAAAEPAWKGEEGTWGSNPALRLLGSREEHKEWDSVIAAKDRAAFIDAFWTRRDPTPGTEPNEFKQMFESRVAFADRMFAAEGERGALTDRGRIFVLLGAPSVVQRRALVNRDNVEVVHEPIIDGTMELWAYSKDQLLVEIPKRAVQYRFVTQKGIGVGVLQRSEEAYATRVLAASGEATIRR
jgi:GWxTD domain-containing protein